MVLAWCLSQSGTHVPAQTAQPPPPQFALGWKGLELEGLWPAPGLSAVAGHQVLQAWHWLALTYSAGNE